MGSLYGLTDPGTSNPASTSTTDLRGNPNRTPAATEMTGTGFLNTDLFSSGTNASDFGAVSGSATSAPPDLQSTTSRQGFANADMARQIAEQTTLGQAISGHRKTTAVPIPRAKPTTTRPASIDREELRRLGKLTTLGQSTSMYEQYATDPEPRPTKPRATRPSMPPPDTPEQVEDLKRLAIEWFKLKPRGESRAASDKSVSSFETEQSQRVAAEDAAAHDFEAEQLQRVADETPNTDRNETDFAPRELILNHFPHGGQRLAHVHAYPIEGQWHDVGTLADLAAANKEWIAS